MNESRSEERSMPISLLRYSTGNIGDDIQTLAVLRQIGWADHFVDRDNMDASSDIGESILILNGWFGGGNPFKIPANFFPLFISFHLSRGTREVKEELLKYGPIGCRDPVTRDKLRMRGLSAFYTGCMTMTFENPHVHRAGGLYMVGVHGEVEHLIPKNIRKSAERLSHSIDQSTSMEDRHQYANELLDRYAQAELVVTSLLHCALPCLAFGTPVVFLHRTPYASRISTARRYLKIWGPHDNPGHIPFNPQPPSIIHEAAMLKRLLRAGIQNKGKFSVDLTGFEKFKLGVSPLSRYIFPVTLPIEYAASAIWSPYKRRLFISKLKSV